MLVSTALENRVFLLCPNQIWEIFCSSHDSVWRHVTVCSRVLTTTYHQGMSVAWQLIFIHSTWKVLNYSFGLFHISEKYYVESCKNVYISRITSLCPIWNRLCMIKYKLYFTQNFFVSTWHTQIKIAKRFSSLLDKWLCHVKWV